MIFSIPQASAAHPETKTSSVRRKGRVRQAWYRQSRTLKDILKKILKKTIASYPCVRVTGRVVDCSTIYFVGSLTPHNRQEFNSPSSCLAPWIQTDDRIHQIWAMPPRLGRSFFLSKNWTLTTVKIESPLTVLPKKTEVLFLSSLIIVKKLPTQVIAKKTGVYFVSNTTNLCVLSKTIFSKDENHAFMKNIGSVKIMRPVTFQFNNYVEFLIAL